MVYTHGSQKDSNYKLSSCSTPGKKRKVLKGTQKVLIILKDGGLYLSPNSTDWVLNLMFCPLVYYYMGTNH